MPNMSPKKNEMPTQAPEVRAHNFNEVATGYSEETALDEALSQLPEDALRQRLPGQHPYPRVYRKDSRERFRGRISGHSADLLFARSLRQGMSSGTPVRKQVRSRHQRRTRRHRQT